MEENNGTAQQSNDCISNISGIKQALRRSTRSLVVSAAASPSHEIQSGKRHRSPATRPSLAAASASASASDSVTLIPVPSSLSTITLNRFFNSKDPIIKQPVSYLKDSYQSFVLLNFSDFPNSSLPR